MVAIFYPHLCNYINIVKKYFLTLFNVVPKPSSHINHHSTFKIAFDGGPLLDNEETHREPWAEISLFFNGEYWP